MSEVEGWGSRVEDAMEAHSWPPNPAAKNPEDTQSAGQVKAGAAEMSVSIFGRSPFLPRISGSNPPFSPAGEDGDEQEDDEEESGGADECPCPGGDAG